MVTELGQLCLPQIRNGVIGMTKKTVLGMPRTVFYVVCSVLVIGIIIGSFYDYQISVALSNTTGIGDFISITAISYPIWPMSLRACACSRG